MTHRSYPAMAVAALLAMAACSGSDDGPPRLPGLGDSCVPSAERSVNFSGFSESEISIETGHDQCETRLCLINHLRGRVSCPYGQSDSDIEQRMDESDWGALCRVPGTDGSRPQDRISVPVAPQKYERRSSRSVYCSCRCANADGNTDDGADYCRCPDGFACEHLVDDIGLGSSELTGSYCIKSGSAYDESETDASPDCTLDYGYPGGWQEHPFQCGAPVPP